MLPEPAFDSSRQVSQIFQTSAHMKTTTLPLKHSTNRSHCPFALLIIPLVLACFPLWPQAQATCQEGCLADQNTVLGDDALLNEAGVNNTAVGFQALYGNQLGFYNTAIGNNALYSNTTGRFNTATGNDAILDNTTGWYNTATGSGALVYNTTGQFNTAIGSVALNSNTTGSHNVALEFKADVNLTSGSRNIDIANPGVAGESSTIRIGRVGDQSATFIAGISGATVPTRVAVIVDRTGHLGTTTSSARFKEAIKPMDKTSEAILSLQPVTFRYKHELDPASIPQFGLVAEDVEKVNPDLVARDEQGKPYTVRYEAVNAMLLNEFLKEHKKVQQLAATVGKLQSRIDKVSARLAAVSPASGGLETHDSKNRLVDNHRMSRLIVTPLASTLSILDLSLSPSRVQV